MGVGLIGQPLDVQDPTWPTRIELLSSPVDDRWLAEVLTSPNKSPWRPGQVREIQYEGAKSVSGEARGYTQTRAAL